jgi:Ca2+-transporting ATPase
LNKEKPYSRWHVFVSQFKSPLIYILFVATFFSFLAGERADAQVIIVTILVNVLIGYIQEDKANNALNKLKLMVEHHALVLREGKELEIPAAELVVGDVLVLRPGRLILADARLFVSSELEINEASLTGESSAITKKIEPNKSETSLADRTCMVYAGTGILNGNGLAVVVAIGKKTEIGKISELVKSAVNEKTPLQEKLAGISKVLGIAAIFVCGIVIITGLINGFDFLEIFSAATAIAVAAIPEGLAVAVTVILALGMKKTVKKKALTRNLLAAETLGSISVICSDKTGTLTEGVMQLEKIVSHSDQFEISHLLDETKPNELPDFISAFKIGLLCNNAILGKNGSRNLGSALEVALLKAATNFGFSRENFLAGSPRLAELPFNSEKKFMISLHQEDKKYFLYEKGAGEIILEKCSEFLENGRVKVITAEERRRIITDYEKLTSSGFRVIALAYKQLDKIPFSLKVEHKDWSLIDEKLTFVALAVFKDPLRKEAKNTIALCKLAGIRPIIITGDHPGTAAAIALELKISSGKNEVISGSFLDKIDDAALRKLVKSVSVFARVSPEHKIRIVKALKHNGEVVAMTGDGLNDSPALKAADIGVCLGSGTEVARETADVVLLDDNFKVIVDAIKQGRIIFDNIRKSLTYIISDSFSEMILILGSILFHTPLALMPLQILWINIINDGLPSFSLAFENGDDGVMKRRPVKRNEPIFNGEMKRIILGVGLVRDFFIFGLFYFLAQRLTVLGWSLEYLRTLFFSILICKSLFSIFSIRSFYLPIYKIKHKQNPFLFFAFGLGLCLMLLAVYLPFLNKVLKTVPLKPSAWLIIFGIALINVLMIEIAKLKYLRLEHKK